MNQQQPRNRRVVVYLTDDEFVEVAKEAATDRMSVSDFGRLAMADLCTAHGNLFFSSISLRTKKEESNTCGVHVHTSRRSTATDEEVQLANWIIASLQTMPGADHIVWVRAESLALGIQKSGCTVADIQAAFRASQADKFGKAKWNLRLFTLPHWVDGKSFAELVRWHAAKQTVNETTPLPEAAAEDAARRAAMRAGMARQAELEAAQDAVRIAEEDALLRKAGHDPAALTGEQRCRLVTGLVTRVPMDTKQPLRNITDALRARHSEAKLDRQEVPV